MPPKPQGLEGGKESPKVGRSHRCQGFFVAVGVTCFSAPLGLAPGTSSRPCVICRHARGVEPPSVAPEIWLERGLAYSRNPNGREGDRFLNVRVATIGSPSLARAVRVSAGARMI